MQSNNPHTPTDSPTLQPLSWSPAPPPPIQPPTLPSDPPPRTPPIPLNEPEEPFEASLPPTHPLHKLHQTRSPHPQPLRPKPQPQTRPTPTPTTRTFRRRSAHLPQTPPTSVPSTLPTLPYNPPPPTNPTPTQAPRLSPLPTEPLLGVPDDLARLLSNPQRSHRIFTQMLGILGLRYSSLPPSTATLLTDTYNSLLQFTLSDNTPSFLSQLSTLFSPAYPHHKTAEIFFALHTCMALSSLLHLDTPTAHPYNHGA